MKGNECFAIFFFPPKSMALCIYGRTGAFNATEDEGISVPFYCRAHWM